MAELEKCDYCNRLIMVPMDVHHVDCESYNSLFHQKRRNLHSLLTQIIGDLNTDKRQLSIYHNNKKDAELIEKLYNKIQYLEVITREDMKDIEFLLSEETRDNIENYNRHLLGLPLQFKSTKRSKKSTKKSKKSKKSTKKK